MSVLKVIFGLSLAVGAMAAPDRMKFIRSLGNDQGSMDLKMNLMLDLLERQEGRIETLESAVSRLEETVERQREEIASLHQRAVKESTAERNAEQKSVILRNCEEMRSVDPGAASGTYWIDPDGVGSGDPPISVYCDMTTGATLIFDSEDLIEADRCLEPGCYSRIVSYNATMRQMVALTELSRSCRQFFRFDCYPVPFGLNGETQAWWNDRNVHPQYFWMGSNDTVHTCQCGIDGNCVVSNVHCNCDTVTGFQLIDEANR